MKLVFKICTCIFVVLIMADNIYAKNDRKGSKDHPFISRMPDFYIGRYTMNEHETHTFRDSTNKKVDIKGRKYFIEYRLKKTGKAPGQLMIIKNHENAFKKINGKIWKKKKGNLYCKVVKDGKEVWIHVKAFDRYYRLTIVEREKMKQKIEANPDALFGDIATTGHAAVYGIYFDHGSANIKSESKPSLKAIADMLKANKSLKLFVVGHTDMTGKFEYNMQLSLKRAQSVVNVLIKKHRISVGRLKGKGAGPLCPVGSNKNENGRKLNRRVELVER